MAGIDNFDGFQYRDFGQIRQTPDSSGKAQTLQQSVPISQMAEQIASGDMNDAFNGDMEAGGFQNLMKKTLSEGDRNLLRSSMTKQLQNSRLGRFNKNAKETAQRTDTKSITDSGLETSFVDVLSESMDVLLHAKEMVDGPLSKAWGKSLEGLQSEFTETLMEEFLEMAGNLKLSPGQSRDAAKSFLMRMIKHYQLQAKLNQLGSRLISQCLSDPEGVGHTAKEKAAARRIRDGVKAYLAEIKKRFGLNVSDSILLSKMAELLTQMLFKEHGETIADSEEEFS